MSSVSPFIARYQQLAESLKNPARAEAAAFLLENGLPTPREEAWKYTNLRGLNDLTLSAPGVAVALPALPEFYAATPRAVFASGKFRADLSHLPAGISFEKTAPFLAVADKIQALNTLLCEEAYQLTLAPGQDHGTLLWISLGPQIGEPASSYHPQTRISLAAGAKLQLIEIFAGASQYIDNPVLEIDLGEGAELDHVRVNAESTSAFHLARIEADLAARSQYHCFTLTLGAALSRLEVYVSLLGAHSSASINAAQKLIASQHGDITSIIRHRAPHTSSRQTIKNVLDDHSRAVFQGRIEVARVAQKTDGYQMNQTLLLSDHAEIDAKPELEIFADDVKCSHGATVGALNDEQVFYLRSRGIDHEAARAILIEAFLQTSLDDVRDDATRAWLSALLSNGKL